MANKGMLDALKKARMEVMAVKKSSLHEKLGPKKAGFTPPDAKEELNEVAVDPAAARESEGMNDELVGKDGEMLKVVNTGSPDTSSVAEDMGDKEEESPETEAKMLERLMGMIKGK